MVGGLADAAFDEYADVGCADMDSDGYQEPSARHLAFSDNADMEDDVVAGYGIVTMVAGAVHDVDIVDPAAIDQYLHENENPGHAFPFSSRSVGNAIVRPDEPTRKSTIS